MKMTAIGRSALEAREGVRLEAYLDSVGVWTIGYGHTASCGTPVPAKGVRITQQEADDALTRDLAKFEKAVTDAVKVPLDDHQFDALVSIAFNIGVGWFGVGGHQVATFVRLLNAGNISGCADHILDFVKPVEITTRRKAEREQFLTPYSTALPRPTLIAARIAPSVGPANVPPEASAPLPPFAVLSLGSPYTDAVRALQSDLGTLGYMLAADGKFGPGTEKVVKLFQSAHGLTADGKVGAITRQAVTDAILAKAADPPVAPAVQPTASTQPASAGFFTRVGQAISAIANRQG